MIKDPKIMLCDQVKGRLKVRSVSRKQGDAKLALGGGASIVDVAAKIAGCTCV